MDVEAQQKSPLTRASRRLVTILTGFVSVGSVAMLVVLGSAIHTAVG